MPQTTNILLIEERWKSKNERRKSKLMEKKIKQT